MKHKMLKMKCPCSGKDLTVNPGTPLGDSDGTVGLFDFPDFLHTQLKFSVRQREFVASIVPAIIFSQDIVINSNILGCLSFLFPGLSIS